MTRRRRADPVLVHLRDDVGLHFTPSSSQELCTGLGQAHERIHNVLAHAARRRADPVLVHLLFNNLTRSTEVL